MKVIVAGLSKTGTKTMCSALNKLGYKTYDYMENMWFLGNEWNKILTTGGSVEDFKRMYHDVDAVTDVPACYFWEEILEAFPDAKIILTTREEKAWCKSLERQMKSFDENIMYKMLQLLTPTGRRYFEFSLNTMTSVFGQPYKNRFSSRLRNKMLALQMFRRHNLYVLQTAPKDKLLVYDVKQGWGPLCEFLGIDVPNNPFPHKNKDASVYDEMMKENVIAIKIMNELKIILVACVAIFGLILAIYFA